MYGIFTNIYPKNHPNVGKYTIHGAYGYYQLIITNPTQAPEAATPAAEFNASSGFLQRVPEEEVRLDKLPRPFYCDPLEHVIVINLQDERGKPKRDSLAQELEKAGINSYNFFPAVDHEIDEQLKSEMSAQDQLCDTLPKCKSTLGRALSHRQVHEKIIAEQWSCAMILEDHAKLAENFTSRLREVARDSFPGFDVIQLGRCEAKGTGKDAPPKDQSTVPTLFQGWPGRCAHAYVASIYGAVSMAQAHTPISLGRDVLLSGNHKYENRFRAHVDHKKPAGSYWYLVGFREPFGTRAARMETSSVSIIVDFEDATLTDGFG
ncbi:unnamed protein product [Cladocopium goreaui]|uniref:Inactive glycosyltransferase 25 family member 3 n=1 Tax=Cladocopium goreaui TaxID=2562237 RepID=A0A9P1BLI0_9DINO|nr:unnamed protein product [Cladocopium goreaui]